MQIERLGRLVSAGKIEELEHELSELRGAIADAYPDVREATEGLRLTPVRPGGLAAPLRSM